MKGSAREALIAEALGDMAALLDRIDAVKPAVEAACQDLLKASEQLAASAVSVEGRVVAVAESATVKAVQHVARRTQELVKTAANTETRRLQATARDLLRSEIAPALARLGPDADAVRRLAARALFKWCAATAIVTALATVAATYWALTV